MYNIFVPQQTLFSMEFVRSWGPCAGSGAHLCQVRTLDLFQCPLMPGNKIGHFSVPTYSRLETLSLFQYQLTPG